tara:strand:+ start:6196 stop:6876 length:681 start_codon:yes stop_codon:yes gene_type:complete
MYRYELKLILDDKETINFLNWFDFNSLIKKKYSKRFVNSVYFDSANNICANENLAGLPNRKKFRIRWYNQKNNSDFTDPSLEIKIKEGRVGYKKKFKLNKNEFIYKDLKFKNLLNIFNNNFIRDDKTQYLPILQPKIHVNYEREYYQSIDDIRITVDKKIIFYEAQYNKLLFKSSNSKFFKNIIEIKFKENFKNRISEKIRKTPFNFNRSSKYLLGLSKLYGLSYI